MSSRLNIIFIRYSLQSLFDCLLAGGELSENIHRFCKYYWNDRKRDCRFYNALLTMTILLLLDALVVFGVSVWGIVTNSSAIVAAKACGCCCSCCDDSPTETQTPIVIYLPVSQVCEI